MIIRRERPPDPPPNGGHNDLAETDPGCCTARHRPGRFTGGTEIVHLATPYAARAAPWPVQGRCSCPWIVVKFFLGYLEETGPAEHPMHTMGRRTRHRVRKLDAYRRWDGGRSRTEPTEYRT
jgi:hypothetical protein